MARARRPAVCVRWQARLRLGDEQVQEWEQSALPPEYQCILAAVRQAAGPVMTRAIGEAPGLDTGMRGASWSRCAGS
ncbi:hypothetical protein [Streptomyces sp. 7N604]|uniref:hypothetical protein n=1 Tax=Streptomyces sp. 7N604 TaxID=3457415 RepID=UPI003FD68AFE